jgi:hypothetical protein
MELHLRYLEKPEQWRARPRPSALSSAPENRLHVELLQLPQSDFHVADYPI